MTREDIERFREWAQAKIAGGQEPPWAWYQYMKLRETLDAILDGMSGVGIATEDAPQSETPSDAGLRLVVENNSQDIARRRQDAQRPRLPM
jgi:hypothetical protein